jgi:hypothetical protein
MPAPSIADPTRPASRRRTRAHLRTVPDTSPQPRPGAGPGVVAPSRAPTLPLTVTISVDGGAPEARAHLLATLHELVAAAGRDVVSVAEPMGEPGVVHVDPELRAAFRDGRLLELSRLEYDLLLFFARHPRQVFTRGQLLSEVWGHVHAGARTVDVHVSRLRQKLGGSGELITTVYGVGYRLADAAPVRVVPPRAGSRSWTA